MTFTESARDGGAIKINNKHRIADFLTLLSLIGWTQTQSAIKAQRSRSVLIRSSGERLFLFIYLFICSFLRNPLFSIARVRHCPKKQGIPRSLRQSAQLIRTNYAANVVSVPLVPPPAACKIKCQRSCVSTEEESRSFCVASP